MKLVKLLVFVFFVNFVAVAQQNGRVIVSNHGTDVSYRISRCLPHLQGKKVEQYKSLKSGEALLDVLTGNQPIELWVHFSHGRTDRIYGKNPKLAASWFSNGLVLKDDYKSTYDDVRSLSDLQNQINNGTISFASNAVIFLGACGVGEPDSKSGLTFAQELANITGARVIGGGHQTEPVVETYQQLAFHSHIGFKSFSPFSEPVEIGHNFDVTELLKNYISNN